MPTDRQSIELSLRTMFKEGDRIMLGVLRQNNGKESMQHEFYGTVAEACIAAAEFDTDPNVVGIYTTAQQLKTDATSNTKNDVSAYVRFVVDVDRKSKKVPLLDSNGAAVADPKTGKVKMRPTNATEQERAELLAVVSQIVPWTSGILGAKPMICDSGNGFHLVWFLDTRCEVTYDMQRTVHECILAIKQRFEKGNVDIDASVADPGQLIRLWGTWNRKGIQEEGRPWRQSKILSKASGKVLPSALDVLTCECDTPRPAAKITTEGDERTNTEWLEDYGVPDWCDFAGEFAPLISAYDKNGETHYEIGNCALDTEDGIHVHQGGKNPRHTEIILYPDGSIGFSCFGSDDWFHDQFPEKAKPTFGDLVKRVNQLKGENYPHRIFTSQNDDDDWSMFEIDEVDDDVLEPIVPVVMAVPQEQSSTTQEFRKLQYVLVGEGTDREGNTIQLVGIRASSIEPDILEWLWPGKFPKGTLAAIAGKPGIGKSFLVLDLIARITSGREWPDGTPNTLGPRIVLYASMEDPVKTVTIPRLIAAGANLDNLVILECVKVKGENTRRTFKLMKDDLTAIENAVKSTPEIALLVVDPISSYWSEKTDDNKSKDVKKVLDAYAKACDRHGLTFISVIHHNKRSDTDALGKLMGSTSIGGSIKACWEVSIDPEDKKVRRMAFVKGNFGEEPTGMTYHIEGVPVQIRDKETKIGRVTWHDEPLEKNANELEDEKKSQQEEKRDRKLDIAVALIRSSLPMTPPELEKKFQAEGLSRSAMYRAKESINESSDPIFSEQIGAKNERRWWLTSQWKKRQSETEVQIGDVDKM